MSPASPSPSGWTPRRTRALVVVGLILGVAAVGLNASATFLRLNFRKQAVEPRQSIQSIPSRVGSWVLIGDMRMPADVEAELGTTRYVQRTYVDSRRADPEALAAYEAAEVKTEEVTNAMAGSAITRDPFARISLHVAYYTGSVDTVPHIPDRCMLGAGFEMSRRETQTLPLAADERSGVGDDGLTVSFAAFEDPRGGGQRTVNRVAYFFRVNGDYEHDAISGVRKRLQNLFETHAYFAKIEVGTTGPQGAAAEEASQAAIVDFLTHALPAIEAVLPDWQAVTASQK